MAAPMVTGATALLLAAAAAKGKALSSDDIRAALTAAARQGPPTGNGWDDRYGNGRLSAVGSLQQAAVL